MKFTFFIVDHLKFDPLNKWNNHLVIETLVKDNMKCSLMWKTFVVILNILNHIHYYPKCYAFEVIVLF